MTEKVDNFTVNITVSDNRTDDADFLADMGVDVFVTESDFKKINFGLLAGAARDAVMDELKAQGISPKEITNFS